jgi:hypothetical protein
VRGAIRIVAGLLLLTGCSSAMPVDTTTAKAPEAQQCQRGGGWWRANLGVCDWQGTGSGKQ